MNELLEMLRLWGKRASWGGQIMYVDLLTETHVHLCPYPVCIPFQHTHMKVARWWLRWDEAAQLLYPFWERPR